jgi:hypothetical protein
MGRSDLERLSREELIELVLRLQRPAKTSRTSSKPPATDHKERREMMRVHLAYVDGGTLRRILKQSWHERASDRLQRNPRPA